MDNTLLRQFETLIATEASIAFGLDDPAAAHHGTICETIASLVDHVARVVGSDSAHYRRGKAAEITRYAIALQTKIAAPAQTCGQQVMIEEERGEFVIDCCGLIPGHAGWSSDPLQSNCRPEPTRERLATIAQDVAQDAAELAAAMYRVLDAETYRGTDIGHVDDEAASDALAAIFGLRSKLSALELRLAAVVAGSPVPA